MKPACLLALLGFGINQVCDYATRAVPYDQGCRDYRLFSPAKWKAMVRV